MVERPNKKRLKMPTILKVDNLTTCFETSEGVIRAVDGVDLEMQTGETTGIVGESGCGKSALALSIMRLIPVPPGRIASGAVTFAGRDLLLLNDDEIRQVRGRDISMIFQEPMTSLNPVIRIGEQIAEVSRLHHGLTSKEALRQAVEMLRLVGIPDPEKRIRDYPHQLSGGMRQRVMIAIAMTCNPRLLIADEPTTALDVTIQAQILDLIERLKSETGMSVMMITHDLGVIAETAQQVAVMYAGWIVEKASVEALFSNPLHPYTTGLMDSLPDPDRDYDRNGLLKVIPGSVPNLLHLPRGCRFQDRCRHAMDVCRKKEPPLIEVEPGHMSRCWLFNKDM
ncbi:MAG: Oligopeptide transport ATP-binding protein OppD [Syntrophus sp. PtaB.Bin001]|nr:MAG: Oligopeptide transport ATP-binding protein OppD [Syntrophus sp. PtaB.Bin001]